MLRARRIVWFALAFSTLIYAFLAYTMGQPQRPFEESARQQITIVCYVMALVMFFLAPVVTARMPLQIRMVVGLALSESCAIFGLVAAFIAHDWRIYVPAWIVALIGFTRYWPGEDETAARPGSM
jgi:hypothetical protein